MQFIRPKLKQRANRFCGHACSFYHAHKRKALFIPLVALILLLIILKAMTYGAAHLFNTVAKEQKMFRGTLTVETLSANMLGTVHFTGLRWQDESGQTLAEAPEGSFRVRLYDVLTGNLKTTTVQALTLKNPVLSMRLDDNMQVDFAKPSEDLNALRSKPLAEVEALRAQRREKRRKDFEKNWRNFNREGKKLRLHVEVTGAKAEIFYRERHYLLNSVDFYADLNTSGENKLKMIATGFGGTMEGRAMTLEGTIDAGGDSVPTTDLTVLLAGVDPSSLGFGLNVHDKMTLLVRFQGDVTEPRGTGELRMETLNIPGLSFTGLRGSLTYADSVLRFENIDAGVYGGHLKASGDYDFDTRRYHIQGHGTNLSTSKALPKDGLDCLVDLDISLAANGNPRDMEIKGQFHAGKGTYKTFFPFDSLSGRFESYYHDLRFYDVRIDFGSRLVHTDALRIQNGKLTLAPITITDRDGHELGRYERRD